MNKRFLTEDTLPFCKGCGHATIASNTEKALQRLGLDPLDVVMVTDIGCHGIIDKNFTTHTFHGLHGRSVAAASGISAGLNDPSKKVIVFIGDGGATIGMQHLIDAAHNGFNMTVVIHNNFLYGMTGGQPSEFTPLGFKTPTLPEGAAHRGYDICALVAAAGAGYVQRITGIGDFSEQLAIAFARKGFSLVEVMEICPSYGVKANPGMKLSKLVEEAGIDIKTYCNLEEKEYHTPFREETRSLMDESQEIAASYKALLQETLRIRICGSAGEGVQAAAEMLARAGIMSGLNVSNKRSYPVTVGIGVSSADLILSPREILFSGSPMPDVLVLTSDDGLEYGRATAGKMSRGHLFLDTSLVPPETGAKITIHPFRERAGSRNSALYSLFFLVHTLNLLPMEALKEVFNQSKLAQKLSLDTFLAF